MHYKLPLKLIHAKGFAFIAGLIAFQFTLAAEPPVMLDQGPAWTDAARKDFYSRDQGSRLMPLNWIIALKQPNGEPFMAANLSRYGYLPNEASNPPGLPVGFNVANEKGIDTIGMTCSACHTRQIEVGDKAYRIDGGPAIVDIQSFFADLDTAVGAVLADPKAFSNFAYAVLGPAASPEKEAILRGEVQAWYTPYHTLMERSLPKEPWGISRLDAVSMIFDRLAGLDIGPAPTYLIADNIRVADAPVRYPFLWNAPIQDRTQWPGFSENGDDILALARNLGEVYGTFGIFHPMKDPQSPLGVDYLSDNSANFSGLRALEDLLWKMGPPKWPWGVDEKLASVGKEIYESTTKTEQGGCLGCHGIKPGKPTSRNQNTWATPVLDVGTDSKEYSVLPRIIATGVLEGALIPNQSSQPLKPCDLAINTLSTAVKGGLLQDRVRGDQTQVKYGRQIEVLKSVYKTSGDDGKPMATSDCSKITPPTSGSPVFAYESRVLQGIWAAAPYLHNGSVSSLAELLKPAAERMASFKIGPAYDPEKIGLASAQSKFDYTLKTTDCSGRNSGNSRCGHEFGTKLPEADKKALLEYLKTL